MAQNAQKYCKEAIFGHLLLSTLLYAEQQNGTPETAASLPVKMAGEFCYYFTFGLDAEAAHRFDHMRKSKPWLTKKRKINIFWYMWYIVRTGWFCGASPLNEKIAKLQVAPAFFFLLFTSKYDLRVMH